MTTWLDWVRCKKYKRNMKIYQENKKAAETFEKVELEHPYSTYIYYFNNSQCSSYVFASWRSDALGCYMQLFISGDMACSNIRFKKTKRMDLVNIYR